MAARQRAARCESARRSVRNGRSGRGARLDVIRTTPFHERTSTLNETGLWEHWSKCLVAQRNQMSEKFEYFGIRNAAGLFDTSPLYKYRFSGPDA
jgi:glycine cleavage system aminomethyltransferase T